MISFKFEEVSTSFSALAAAVCLIACHGGPADHFATFAESLSRDVGAIEVYASGPALKKFQERGIEVKVPFSIDKISPEEEDILAEQIAKACSTASVIITDVAMRSILKFKKHWLVKQPMFLVLPIMTTLSPMYQEDTQQ